jgi:hypothetical protein
MDTEPSLFLQDPCQQAYAMSGKRRRTSSDNVTQKRARFTPKQKEEEKSRLLKSLEQTKTQVKRKYGKELDDLEALEFQVFGHSFYDIETYLNSYNTYIFF